MHRHPDMKRRYARLIIALAMAMGGLVSVSLSWFGKWTGVREPMQISRTNQPATSTAPTAN
jgi:hypothetical protein